MGAWRSQKLAMRLLSNHFLSLILFSLVSVVTVALGQTELFYAKKIGGTATGFASYHCETERFEIKSRISNISDSADSFQFVYRELTGDLDITVHVPSISASLAGLMIRSGSVENQSFAMVGIEGSNTITRQRMAFKLEPPIGYESAVKEIPFPASDLPMEYLGPSLKLER